MAEYDKTINDAATMRGMDSTLGHIDQYELVRELGGGGFGTVYLAKDTVAGIEVAVKGLPPIIKNNAEELDRIRENFALVSRLHHPYIAAVLHLQLARDVYYVSEDVRQKLRVMPGDTLMVMEYAPGVTLSKWRKQFPDGKVPLEQAIQLVWQVAQALDFAHEQHILHRDVKPSNIMVETKPDGDVIARLLDFGLAAEIRSSMGRVSREIHDTSGTRPYMAPEQWEGRKQGPATDQYALAVLLCELLTGEVPFASVFETGDPVVMMTAICNRDVELPEGCPRQAALRRALAKEPLQRFSSCMEFVESAAKSDCVTRHPHVSRRGAGAQRGALAQVSKKGGAWKVFLGVALLGLAIVGVKALASRAEVTSGTTTVNHPPADVSPVPPVQSVQTTPPVRSAPPVRSVPLAPPVPVPDENTVKAAATEIRIESKVRQDKAGRKGYVLWKDGPYWADRNIGAENPWDYGDYFWWGDTLGYRPSGTAFGFRFSCDNPIVYTYGDGKSVPELQSAGWLTREGVLAPEHDAAHVQWGCGWRMPTGQEIRGLNYNCDWTWTTTNGVCGYVVSGRGDYAANSIFLPCAGFGADTRFISPGSCGHYWSSAPSTDKNAFGYEVQFDSKGHRTMYHSRRCGHTIRPVQRFTK